MIGLNPDSRKLLELLNSGQKLTAMVAPSFPCDFTEEQIVYGLKSLGFDKVVDLSLAIATVNKAYEEYLTKNKNTLVIAANCPATVNLIKTRFPDLEKYLGPIYSPMVTMGKICREKYPVNLNIFIGPCLVKKIEAQKFPQYLTLALTYQEIIDIFQEKRIDYLNSPSIDFKFEGFHSDFLHLFPASGGVKATIKEGVLSNEEIIICDGPEELTKLLVDLKNKKLSTKVRFLDVLFCRGGCIGGPGIKSNISLECRKAKFLRYRKLAKNKPLCSEADIKNAIDPTKCSLNIK